MGQVIISPQRTSLDIALDAVENSRKALAMSLLQQLADADSVDKLWMIRGEAVGLNKIFGYVRNELKKSFPGIS